MRIRKKTKFDKIFRHLRHYNILLQTYITTFVWATGDVGVFWCARLIWLFTAQCTWILMYSEKPHTARHRNAPHPVWTNLQLHAGAIGGADTRHVVPDDGCHWSVRRTTSLVELADLSCLLTSTSMVLRRRVTTLDTTGLRTLDRRLRHFPRRRRGPTTNRWHPGMYIDIISYYRPGTAIGRLCLYPFNNCWKKWPLLAGSPWPCLGRSSNIKIKNHRTKQQQ